MEGKRTKGGELLVEFPNLARAAFGAGCTIEP